jgi:hypothetical protein
MLSGIVGYLRLLTATVGHITPYIALVFVMYLGILTFGDNESFDLIFMSVLFVGIILTLKLPDIWTILLIIFMARLLDKGLLYYTSSSLLSEVLVYCAMLLLLHKFRIKYFYYPLLTLLSLTVAAEIYWHVHGYKPIFTGSSSKPDLYFYWCYIIIIVGVIALVNLRTLWIERFFNVETQFTALDYDLGNLYRAFLVLEMSMILEYLARHLTPYNPLFIYAYYTEIKHLFGAVLMFLIIRLFLGESAKRLLKA